MEQATQLMDLSLLDMHAAPLLAHLAENVHEADKGTASSAAEKG